MAWTNAEYYFDASDSGPTDAGAVWTDDANAFDGNDLTFANTTSGSAVLTAGGTTAPTSGDTINWVGVELKQVITNDTLTVEVRNGSSSGQVLGSAPFDSNSNRFIALSEPTGGWTWTILNNLWISITTGASATSCNIYKCFLRVISGSNAPILEEYNTADTAGATATSLTISALTGIQAGELLFAFGASDADNENGAVLSTSETGWTKLGEVGTGTEDVHVAGWYKVASGSEGSFTFDSTVSDELIGVYGRVSGCHATDPLFRYWTHTLDSDTSTPWNVFAFSTALFTPTAVDTDRDTDFLLVAFGCTDGSDMVSDITTQNRTPNLDSVTPLEFIAPEAGGNDVGGIFLKSIAAYTDTTPNGYTPTTPSQNDGQAGFALQFQGTGTTYSETDADATGSATTSFNSEALKKTDGSATGSATTSFQAGGIIEAVGTSTSSSTTTGYSAAVREAEGSTNITALYDTFTDTNGTALTSHTSDVGGTWVTASGWGTSPQITDNQVQGGAPVRSGAVQDIGSSDLVATFNAYRGTDSQSSYFIFRVTDLNNHLAVRIENAQVLLRRTIGGSIFTLDSWASDLTGTHSYKLTASGADLNLYVDGILRCTGTTSSFISNTDHGVALDGITDARIDNLRISTPITTVVDGQASSIAVAISTAAGSATINGLASASVESAFDISGQATVTGLTVQGETAFAASSSATAQFDAATIDSGVANVSGISSIIFAVNATNTSTATSDGLTTTNVQTAIVSQADASTSASATVVGNSAAIGAAVGTIASTSSITFITTSDAQATATSSGSTTINVTTVAIWNEIATATAQATTSADSGSINLTIASATGLSTVTGLSTATYEFEAFRFRNDNGTEITATWKAVQDANISLNTNVIVRLRTLIDSTGDADPAQVTLQYRKVGEAENDWRNV